MAEPPKGCSQIVKVLTCVTSVVFENCFMISKSSAGEGMCDFESQREDELYGICSFKAAASFQQLSSALSQVNM